MKCKHCGYETNSETIFYLHENSCLKVQEENGILGGDNKKPYEKLGWPELKAYAVEKGIAVQGKKKEVILLELDALENPEGDPGGGQDDHNTGKGEGGSENNQ